MKKSRLRICCSLFLSLLVMGFCLGAVGHAQAPAAAPAAAAPAPASGSADAELKDAAGKAPTMMQLQNGDPGGSITGTINDVPAADSKAGVTLPDVATQV